MTNHQSPITLPVTVSLERSFDSHVKRGLDHFMNRCSRVVSSTTLSSRQTWNQDAVPSTEFQLQPRVSIEYETAEDFFCFLRLEWCKEPTEGLGWLTPDETARVYSESERRTPVHHDVGLRRFAIGAFKERSTFVNHYDASEDVSILVAPGSADLFFRSLERRVTFEHDRRQLAVFFQPSTDDGLHKFEVDYDDLENFILVKYRTVRHRLETELYFFLKHPLKVFRATDRVKGCRVDKIKSVNAQTVWKRTTSFAGCTSQDLGSSSCLQLVIDNDGAVTDIPHRVLSRLCQTCGFTAHYVSVHCTKPLPVPEKPKLTHFECAYPLEAFLSRGFSVMDQVTSQFYQKLQAAKTQFGPRFVCDVLQRLTLTIESNRFADIDTALRELLRVKDVLLETEQTAFPAAHRMVRRVFVTPTRLVYMHPEIVRDNRILRKYGEDSFMRVSIRDEDFGKLQTASGQTPVEEETPFTRVRQVLQNGLTVGDRHYEFLAASNSQLREHNVWFFASDGENTAESIKRDMGNFSHIRCPATVLARMGQCFSNTQPSVMARSSAGEVYTIPDVEAGDDTANKKPYCFSDGIGRISPSLAQKVYREIGRNGTDVPSAYQIRYGGVKGVVAIDPSLCRDVMQVRPSMTKFQSPDKNIEICMTSHPARLYLNRQVITILSALGVPDETFQTLQEEMLQNLSDMLLKEDVAFDAFLRRAQPLGLPLGKLSRCGLHLTTEPFFRAVLQKIFATFLGELRRRARIEIPPEYGRHMLGVLDETGTLDYGEVFVQYTRDIVLAKQNKKTIILTGDVVVTRNPCFHPGDVRKLRAVDVPALHHMVDVIVFPSKGPRPHPTEMSGGDLDGDQYFVTWHPDLIFPKPNEEPMHFISQPKRELSKVETTDIIDFIVEYIKNDRLGQIANAHLAFAHTQKEGIFSQICLTLSAKHSDAVDFPKTGVCPSLEKDERPLEYPDFMGKKKGKTMRRSEAAQGKMYRECQAVERVCSHLHENNDFGRRTIEIDPDLKHDGCKRYAVSSRQARDQYNEVLQDLMRQYGIATEAEAVSGCIIRMHRHMEDRYEKFEAERIAKERIAYLRKQTRQEFFAHFGGEENVDLDHCPDEVMAKASAWYHASYSVGNPDLLSFPWVVADVLAMLKRRNVHTPLHVQPVVDTISRDLEALYGTQFYTTARTLTGPSDSPGIVCYRRSTVLLYIRHYADVMHLVSFLLHWGKEHLVWGQTGSQINQIYLLFLFVTYAVNHHFFEDMGNPTQNESMEMDIFIRQTYETRSYKTLSLQRGNTTELLIGFLKYLSSYKFKAAVGDIHDRSRTLSCDVGSRLHDKALKAYHLLAQTGDIRLLANTTVINKEIVWEGMEIPHDVWEKYFYRQTRERKQELLEVTGAQVSARVLERVLPYRGHLSAFGTEESISKLKLVMERLMIDSFNNRSGRRLSIWSFRFNL